MSNSEPTLKLYCAAGVNVFIQFIKKCVFYLYV